MLPADLNCPRRSNWLWLLLALGATVCEAQGRFPASDLRVTGIYATRPNDFAVYCLSGGWGCLLAQDSGAADAFIAAWLAKHPAAVAIPISAQTKVLPSFPPPPHEVYIWIEDGSDNLTLSLVREGFYAAPAMVDMVETDQRFTAGLNQALSGSETMRAEMERRRAQVPAKYRPRRLVSEGEYAERMAAAMAAEKQAKRDKKGIWSELPPAAAAIASEESFSTRDLHITGIRAHRRGHADIYCLLGGDTCVLGWLAAPPAEKESRFIARWLAAHPLARAIPISKDSRKVHMDLPPVHSTYIWIEDAKDSLNLYLIREGFYQAHSMTDMVDSAKRFEEMLSDPRLTSGREEIDKEGAEEDAPQRLVSQSDYAERMRRAEGAEQEAKRARRGLWSDAGMKHWNPPSDAHMLEEYTRHKQWFKRVESLVASDERLAQIGRDPESVRRALGAGVSREKVNEYVHLLERLDANETLSGVYGLGRVCLITADIVYGAFDTGIIKGYVLSPSDPHPLVEDLEDWPPAFADATTAYKRLADGWYLFELHH